MEAINRLRRSGLSTAQIASGTGCSRHLIRLYERGLRFPNRKNFTCIVELAESRGIVLLARDFIGPATQVACEPNGTRADGEG